MFYPISSIGDLMKTGKVRALGITTAQRAPAFADVPTMKELGFLDFENSHPWVGAFAPAGTPSLAVTRLSKAMQESVRNGKLGDALVRTGAMPVGSSSEEFAKFVHSDTVRWKGIVEAAGIKPE